MILELRVMDPVIQSLFVESPRNEEEEVLKNKIELFLKNKKDILNDNSNLDSQATRNLKLIKLYEESLEMKSKTVQSKRLFLEYLSKIREQHQDHLQLIFDELNQVEDEYSTIENTISNLQRAHRQNSEEAENVKVRTEHLHKMKLSIEKESQILGDEVKVTRNMVQQKQEEMNNLNARNEDMRVQIVQKSIEYEKIQNRLFLEGFVLFEQKEKLSYMEESISRFFGEISNIQKVKEKYKFEINAKVGSLREVLNRKDVEESEFMKAEKVLRIIEQEKQLEVE